jgi:glycosyltransferase involved in cell wall biosynthesis
MANIFYLSAFLMNILLINHYAGSSRHGMAYRSFYLAREWVKSGHDVMIVAASWSHIRDYQTEITENYQEESVEGIKYIWLKTPKYKDNGLERVINIFTFVAQLFRYSHRLVKQFQPDTIINSNYPLATYPAQYIAKIAKAKLIHEVRDIWPLSLIELGSISPSHPLMMLMQLAENSAYRHADRVVSLLPKAQEHMQQHGMDPAKFAWIPNGIDINESKHTKVDIPEIHQVAFDRLKKLGYFIVGYTGSYDMANCLPTVLEAAALVKHLPIAFVLIGRGLQADRLKQTSLELGLENVIFLPFVTKHTLPAILNQMDALVMVWRKLPIYRFGISPNKLMDYMMSGKPILHGTDAANDPVAESGCGISVPPEDPQSLAAAIKTLMATSISTRIAMGEKGQKYMVEHNDYKILAEKFIQVMIS